MIEATTSASKSVGAQPANAANADAGKKWESTAAKEARERLDGALPEQLFFLGHKNDPSIKGFVKLLAEQDFAGAKAYLEKKPLQSTIPATGNTETRTETYTTITKSLLANWDKVASFTTYMYGSANSREKQEYTQQFVDAKVRQANTLRAEEKIAAKYGIKAGMPESVFKIGSGEKFASTTTDTIFPEQEMTVSCFSTPNPGLHRLDTYTGSVSISTKSASITDETMKEQIARATLKAIPGKTAGINYQVEKLNAYLGDEL